MKLIDLSHPVDAQTPVYPGDPHPRLECLVEMPAAEYTAYEITAGTHVGTHLDAPRHMLALGAFADEIPVERLCGRGVLVDARGLPAIDVPLLEGIILQPGDIVVVLTGHSAVYHEPGYFERYPLVTEAFALNLLAAHVAVLGLDTPSPDHAPFAIHKLLLGGGTLIVENLAHVDRLLDLPRFEIYALPVRYHADAAPVRVIARVADDAAV